MPSPYEIALGVAYLLAEDGELHEQKLERMLKHQLGGDDPAADLLGALPSIEECAARISAAFPLEGSR